MNTLERFLAHNQKLQAIREAVIKAVPEIMELKFGCQTSEGIIFTPPRGGKVEIYEAADGRLQEHYTEELEVLGRPIRLSDILLAIAQSAGEPDVIISLIGGGEASLEIPEIRKDFVTLWNLRQDDLSLQSEECIEFLFNLLGAEKEEKTATDPQ